MQQKLNFYPLLKQFVDSSKFEFLGSVPALIREIERLSEVKLRSENHSTLSISLARMNLNKISARQRELIFCIDSKKPSNLVDMILI